LNIPFTSVLIVTTANGGRASCLAHVWMMTAPSQSPALARERADSTGACP